MTDARILKIMAYIPVYATKEPTEHATYCGVFKITGIPQCTCKAPKVQLVTMAEVRNALERFQQELVFNMPDPYKAVDATNAQQATEKHLLGDSGLEIRYVE